MRQIKLYNRIVKLGDVFHVNWKEYVYLQSHCFEGTLLATDFEGQIKFVDTFWGIGGDGKVFTFEEVKDKFNGNFMGNIHDYKRLNGDYEANCYAPEDVMTISEQHACVPSCIFHFVKVGATKNKQIMVDLIEKELADVKREIEYKVNEVERLVKRRDRVNAGELEAY